MKLEVDQLRWNVPSELSAAEQKVAAQAAKGKKLFVFLRENQAELFDEAFQRELIEMYRQTGAGKPPLAPALLGQISERLFKRWHNAVERAKGWALDEEP